MFFDSGGEAATALMGGHITVAATPAPVVPLGPAQAGKVRMIAVPAAAERLTGALADVPTWKEQGVNPVQFATWRVLVGPKGMTADRARLVGTARSVR